MRTRLLAVTIALLFLPVALGAQSTLTGKWQGKTPNGFEIDLDLVAADEKLTGTFTRNGQPIAITDGKVSKNTFTFQLKMDDQTAGFTGEVDGDQMKLWMDRQGPPAAIFLKRVKQR